MRILKIIQLIAVAIPLAPGIARADVKVNYLNPEHYTDAQFEQGNRPADRQEVQAGLTKIFSSMAAKYLGPDRLLTVDVTEVDLAGRFEFSSANDIRLMLPVTWPHMEFTYTVSEGGAPVTSGRAKVSDLDYLRRINMYSSSDRLRYERQMLADWFGRLSKSLKPPPPAG